MYSVWCWCVLCFRCLEYLLHNDANPGIRDKQGYNAVHYASTYGHRLCLELVSLYLFLSLSFSFSHIHVSPLFRLPVVLSCNVSVPADCK